MVLLPCKPDMVCWPTFPLRQYFLPGIVYFARCVFINQRLDVQELYHFLYSVRKSSGRFPLMERPMLILWAMLEVFGYFGTPKSWMSPFLHLQNKRYMQSLRYTLQTCLGLLLVFMLALDIGKDVSCGIT